ncbi:hypothetical protein JNUCC64_03225 [Streptomyces sp. JNUCC 64]
MIHLSFSPPGADSPWRKTWEAARQVGPANIAEIDLRYNYFGANVEMVIDGVEVISKRRFVTLVDLAFSLSQVVNRISVREDAAFGFTESEEVIHLRFDGDRVFVSSSKRDWRIPVEPGEVVDGFAVFLREVYSCLTSEIPGLGENPVIRKILPG